MVTTEPVGQGIRITATEKTSSSYGYGDYESITTFTIPEINDNSGYSEIKDFNLQYTFTPNAEKYPDLESEHYEVEAATIPLDTTYPGLLRWHDVYVIGKSSFMLKNYQKGLNHYSGNPKEGDYITIRISFE